MEINWKLSEYKISSILKRGKEDKFVGLIQNYLLTNSLHINKFQKVWLSNDFSLKSDVSLRTIGISKGFTGVRM